MIYYLCGAIDKASDGGIGWRRALTEQRAGHTILDPTQKPNQHLAATAKAALAAGDIATAKDCMSQVRTADLQMLVECDMVLAYIDPDDKPCGSYFELAYARALGKPIVVVVPGGAVRAPLWLLAEFEVRESFSECERH